MKTLLIKFTAALLIFSGVASSIKKIFPLLTAILLFRLFVVSAQDNSNSDNYRENSASEQHFYKHEIGVSCGLFATPIIIPTYHGLFPSLNLSYYYNFNKHHAIGVTLSSFYGGVYYFKEYHQVYNFQFEGIILSPQINYRVSYCQKKAISLYSVLSLGWKIPIGFKDNWVVETMATFPALHVTLIGMRIGNQKDALNIEVGYGTQGSVILGYTHKFSSKKNSNQLKK